MEYMILTHERIKVLSGINRDIAQVLFASMFLAPMIGEKTDVILALFGLILSFSAWSASLILTANNHHYD